VKSKLCFFDPLGSGGYELCHPTDKDGFESVRLNINGVSRNESWSPTPVEIIHRNRGEKLLRSDSPWLGSHALIFRSSAIIGLGPLLRENGELLPLACVGAELMMYNPIKLLDALDENASSITRFDNGRIMRVRNYVFREEIVDGIDVFKIPNLRVSPTFVSQRFVDRWNELDLKGLDFAQVWANEPGSPNKGVRTLF
jgi:hypothetical protein